MRIVLVNWAKIWDGASHGGGVNGYCQALALALQGRGHDVVSLVGGTTHLPSPGPGLRSPCIIRRHEDWLGVRVFEVVNSPVLAPSIQQFQDPMGEVSAPELEDRVGELFEALKPDVIHWHNIEGFSIGCVERGRRAGARTVFSLHNYHTICPQVYLMRGHRVPCTDFDNGHACSTCIETKPTAVERQIRIDGYAKLAGVDLTPPPPPPTVAQTAAELAESFSWLGANYRRAGRLTKAALRSAGVLSPRPAPPMPEVPLPGYRIEDPPTTAAELAAPALDTRGQTQAIFAERNPAPPPDFDNDPAYRPLLNIIQPEPPSEKHPTDYARRRSAMVEMLSACDAVLAVSDFVRDKFISLGVPPGRIRTLHIGSRIGRLAEHHHKLIFDPPPFRDDLAWDRQRPIRIVFMGYNHYYKGLGMFAESLELLEARHLGRLDLSVHALDGQSIEWMFRRMEPRLARLTFTYGYQYNDIPWHVGGKDLGVVCSVWWDNAPQTVFEFLACGVPVLGAEVGGIPDFVTDGHNGRLFRANDRRDLAAKLIEIIENPGQLTALRANVRPPKDIEVNAVELEQIYARGPA
jgi:glycosyltransferase involved in cell wall biosynthesis